MPRIKYKKSGSGRLTASSRRRKLKESEPGAALILNSGRRLGRTRIGAREAQSIKTRRKSYRGGVRATKGSLLEVGFRVAQDVGVDLDARKLLYYVQTALGGHVKESHVTGVTPDDGSPLPKIKPATKRRSPDRIGGYGMNTGKLAEMWGQSPIEGGFLKARAKIKPAATVLDKGRSIFINDSLRRGVDFQSVQGRAAEVIREAVDRYMADAVTDRNGKVSTPESIPTWGGWKKVEIS